MKLSEFDIGAQGDGVIALNQRIQKLMNGNRLIAFEATYKVTVRQNDLLVEEGRGYPNPVLYIVGLGILNVSIAKIGSKGVFTEELEVQLQSGDSFASPEFFQRHNLQQEVNLHNFLTGPTATWQKKIIEIAFETSWRMAASTCSGVLRLVPLCLFSAACRGIEARQGVYPDTRRAVLAYDHYPWASGSRRYDCLRIVSGFA